VKNSIVALYFSHVVLTISVTGVFCWKFLFEFRVNEGSEEIEHLKELDVGGRVLLKLILKEYSERVSIGFIWFRIGRVGGRVEHRSEPWGSIKYR
jgi:hypothetical protein